jgi:anti-sigma B factor antagonist
MEEVKIIEGGDGTLVVALSGEIHSGNADSFYETVMSAYKESPADILFDGEKLEFIDSTTLGAFVKILKAVRTDGKKMSLKNLQAKIKKLFVICSLDTIMEIA